LHVILKPSQGKWAGPKPRLCARVPATPGKERRAYPPESWCGAYLDQPPGVPVAPSRWGKERGIRPRNPQPWNSPTTGRQKPRKRPPPEPSHQSWGSRIPGPPPLPSPWSQVPSHSLARPPSVAWRGLPDKNAFLTSRGSVGLKKPQGPGPRGGLPTVVAPSPIHTHT